MRRRTLLGIGGGCVLAALGGFVAVQALNRGRFDAARWKAQRNSGARDNPRSGMLGDLERRLRPGMTRAEVRDLLGEPESERGAVWIYDLGASPYGIDYEYYELEFDQAGRLVRALFTRG